MLKLIYDFRVVKFNLSAFMMISVNDIQITITQKWVCHYGNLITARATNTRPGETTLSFIAAKF